MTVRFVYFDLGNVLVAFDPEIACGNVARLFGVPVRHARSVVYTSGLPTALERGDEARRGDLRRRRTGIVEPRAAGRGPL